MKYLIFILLFTCIAQAQDLRDLQIDYTTPPTNGQVPVYSTSSSTWSPGTVSSGSAHGNGANCSAGSYPLGVDADGAVESCTDATTEINSAISTHTSNASAHHTKTTAASEITSGTFDDARISESSVTQHEAALTITESQISDLAHTVDTNTNAATICAGTTTYLDGEGNCDDISSVYQAAGSYMLDTGDSATGDYTFAGDIALNGGDLTSTSAAFNLLTTPTGVNFATAITAMNLAASASDTTITYGTSAGGTKNFNFNVGSTKQGVIAWKHQNTSKWALYSTDPTDSLKVYSYTNGANLFTFAPTAVTSAVETLAPVFTAGIVNASETRIGATTNASGHEGIGIFHDGTEGFLTSVDNAAAWHDFTISAAAFRVDEAGVADTLVFDNATLTTSLVNATTGFKINSAAATGTILRGNGTNYVATTATYPTTTTSTRVLYSSAANTINESANLTFNGTTLTTTAISTPSVTLSSTTRWPWSMDWTPRTAKLPTTVGIAPIVGGGARDIAQFVDGSDTCLQLDAIIPVWYNSSQTMIMSLFWRPEATAAGAVGWFIKVMAVSSGDNVDADTDSYTADNVNTASTTALNSGTAGRPTITSITISAANRDSMAGRDSVSFLVCRDGNGTNVTDSMAATAELEKILLEAY